MPRPPEEIIANYPVEDNEATNVGLLDGNKPDGKLISKLESTDMKTDSGTSVFSHSHPLENYKTDHTLFEDLGSSHELGDFLQGNRPSCREVRLLDQSVLRQKSEGLPSKGSTEKELEGFEDSPTMCNVEIESSECIEGPANYNVVLEANDKLELLLQHHQSQLLGMRYSAAIPCIIYFLCTETNKKRSQIFTRKIGPKQYKVEMQWQNDVSSYCR